MLRYVIHFYPLQFYLRRDGKVLEKKVFFLYAEAASSLYISKFVQLWTSISETCTRTIVSLTEIERKWIKVKVLDNITLDLPKQYFPYSHGDERTIFNTFIFVLL